MTVRFFAAARAAAGVEDEVLTVAGRTAPWPTLTDGLAAAARSWRGCCRGVRICATASRFEIRTLALTPGPDGRCATPVRRRLIVIYVTSRYDNEMATDR